MKKILLFVCTAVLAFSCADLRENEFGRLDFFNPDDTPPSPVTVRDVRSICGGAVIKYDIPDDDRIKGVVAIYERNGETVKAKASRYVDSLVVEGFPDTETHEVNLHSFSAAEVLSTSVPVKIKPDVPTIRTVKASMFPTFGGLQVLVEGNPSRDNLAVTILRCTDLSDLDRPVKDIKWEEVTTLFTESDNIKLTRRGIDTTRAIFGVYLRDNWGSKTDTITSVFSPFVEVELDKSKFKYANPGDDNISSLNESFYPLSTTPCSLFDGSGASATPHFFASNPTDPMPGWVTIDLGAVCQIDRIETLPRIGYEIWRGAQVRDFEFWGSMAPTGRKGKGEHEFDDTWFCLGKFTQFKPSGYNQDGTVGETSVEDNTYFNDGNDFELNADEYPHAYDNVRYLRIVFANTFSTFELGAKVGQVQFGEVTPFGLYVDENK